MWQKLKIPKARAMVADGLGSRSNENLDQSVRSGTGNERFGRVESHVEYALVELHAMRCDLLNARFGLKVPQPDAGVMTCV